MRNERRGERWRYGDRERKRLETGDWQKLDGRMAGNRYSVIGHWAGENWGATIAGNDAGILTRMVDLQFIICIWHCSLLRVKCQTCFASSLCGQAVFFNIPGIPMGVA